MPIHKTEAIILNRWDFRETSLISSFFTRDFGKLSGVLKGIRSHPGKFASTVERFSHNTIIFYRQKGDLHLVSECETRDNFSRARTDMLRAGAGSLIVEFLGAVMQMEDKNEAIFDLALASLKELDAEGSNPDKIATIFKIKMLALSGFKPHFDSCVCCSGKILEQSKFSLAQGGLLCQGCFHKDTSARSIFRGTTASILHIERNTLKDNLKLGMNPQIKKELDMVLNSFINFHLERELKSQKVLNKLAMEAVV